VFENVRQPRTTSYVSASGVRSQRRIYIDYSTLLTEDSCLLEPAEGFARCRIARSGTATVVLLNITVWLDEALRRWVNSNRRFEGSY
jgi:hypothetical protein